MVQKDGPGPYKRCLMVGSCRSVFDWWDVTVNVGMIIVPDCYQCPKRCTVSALGSGVVWFDKGRDWYCTPWTPIIGYGDGPPGPYPF